MCCSKKKTENGDRQWHSNGNNLKTIEFKPASVSWITFMKSPLLRWSHIFNKYLILASILNIKCLLHIYQVVL